MITGYDTPLGVGPVVSKGAQTVRDPHVGRNAATAAATQTAAAKFVRALFVLK